MITWLFLLPTAVIFTVLGVALGAGATLHRLAGIERENLRMRLRLRELERELYPFPVGLDEEA